MDKCHYCKCVIEDEKKMVIVNRNKAHHACAYRAGDLMEFRQAIK